MDFARAQALVDSLSRFGMRFGLARMQRALEALGHPERRYAVLHVAGTNGKGSTCAFAAAILRASGRRVGLYTSPHLERLNERIAVDGEPIPDAAFAQGVEAVLAAWPEALSAQDPATFFELTTALALWHFARERVEVAVLETGLGGRLDATNAVPSQVAAITRIGLDHTALLGDTLAAIASEKAGILKPGARAVLARQAPEALAVLVDAAARAGGAPLQAGLDFALEPSSPGRYRYRGAAPALPELALGLEGAHQRDNAECAVAAALALAPALGAEAIRRGLAEVRWPGRLERAALEPLTVLDGAHNPDGARALAAAVGALYPGRRIHLVLGALADKDVRGIAGALLPLASRLYLCSPGSERALPAEDLARLAAELGAPGAPFGSVAQALEAARREARPLGEAALVLVAGSLYVVGEARRALRSGGAALAARGS